MQQINETMEGHLPPPTPFAVTDAAFARIAHLLSDEPPGTCFMVSVDGGGCSGFQYRYDLKVYEPVASDFIADKNGVQVVVDEVSLPMLAGSVLDYLDELGNAGFQVKNPNATAKCGCGNSFSVKF